MRLVEDILSILVITILVIGSLYSTVKIFNLRNENLEKMNVRTKVVKP